MKRNKKEILFQFKVSPTEAERINKFIEESGLNAASYLRLVAMHGYRIRLESPEPLEGENLTVIRDSHHVRKKNVG